MLQVPLTPVPSQTVTVQLSNQNCRINVYQKFYGIFVDLYVENVLIIGGVIAEDRNPIVRSKYLGFNGDLEFFDTVGTDDPEYSDLGTRYLLIYLTADEVAPQLVTP